VRCGRTHRQLRRRRVCFDRWPAGRGEDEADLLRLLSACLSADGGRGREGVLRRQVVEEVR